MRADVLTSPRVEVDLDARAFTELTIREGWGDGLPCIPPTESLVLEYVAAARRAPDDVLLVLPPSKVACTVEMVAVNAAMTAAPPAAMPLLCAALEAMAEPDYNLASLNATTASVAPLIILNGAQRDELGVNYKGGCLGGGGGSGAAIGRAIQLVMRNVGGQEIGVTSECVFGQPARVIGMVTAEWEEASPWRPLAERRGALGDAATIFGTMGSANICDTVAENGLALAEVIGKSVAYVGANSYVTALGQMRGEIVIAINPVWAKEILARDIPSITDLQALIWQHAAQPITHWPEEYRPTVEALGRVDRDGLVHLVNSPDDVIIFVAGGLGALHATMFHSFGRNLAVTTEVRS